MKVGKLEITHHIHGAYDFKLRVDAKYTSNDNRYPTKMVFTTMLLDISSIGRGRDKIPYRLQASHGDI